MRHLKVAALLILPALSLWADTITIQNASFESTVVSGDGPASTVPGWTHTGGGDGPHWAVGYSDGGGSITTAGQGSQFVTMGGGGSVGTATWSQTVSGFNIGEVYTLSFMLAGEHSGDTNQVVT